MKKKHIKREHLKDKEQEPKKDPPLLKINVHDTVTGKSVGPGQL